LVGKDQGHQKDSRRSSLYMDNGGKGTPTAIAKYNHNTRDLAIIKDQLEASKTMKELLSKGAKL